METPVWEIVAAIITAFGGAGVIILGLSAWLGKVWANRIMQDDRAKHETKLEELRSSLEAENNSDIENIKHELDILKQQHLAGFYDKAKIYRMAVDLVADVLSNYDLAFYTKVSLDLEKRDATNRMRMRVYGYLGIVAPQRVIESYDFLSDFLMDVADGKEDYDWLKVRQYALGFLSEMRKDLGFEQDEIVYKGHR